MPTPQTGIHAAESTAMGRPRNKPPVIAQVQALEPVTTNGVRGLLAQVLEEESTLDAIRLTVMDAIGAETIRQVQCPDCKARFRAPVPDVKGQVASIIALLEQNEGKATERPPDSTQVVIVRPPL